MGDVSAAVVITEAGARELVAALDALERLAGPRGQRLSASLHAIRRELATCATRVCAPVGASVNDIAAEMVSELGSMNLDTKAAAVELGITPDGVRWACRNGHLAAVRLGGRWLITRSSLQTYVASRDRTP